MSLPGHIFDANTLRNLALVGALDLLPSVLSAQLYISRIVREELRRGARCFPQANVHRLTDPRWAAYVARFQELDARLDSLGFVQLEVNSASTRPGEFAFMACLKDEEVMEDGEAESFTLALYRKLTLYSDEFKVFREGKNFSEGHFPCPYRGERSPPYPTITVHSTAWLLLEAVNGNVLSLDAAEELYAEMRDVWPRHPKRSLTALRAGDGVFW